MNEISTGILIIVNIFISARFRNERNKAVETADRWRQSALDAVRQMHDVEKKRITSYVH